MASVITGNIAGSSVEREARLQGLKSLMDQLGIDPKGVRKEIVSATPGEVKGIVRNYNAATFQAWREQASSAPGVP